MTLCGNVEEEDIVVELLKILEWMSYMLIQSYTPWNWLYADKF